MPSMRSYCLKNILKYFHGYVFFDNQNFYISNSGPETIQCTYWPFPQSQIPPICLDWHHITMPTSIHPNQSSQNKSKKFSAYPVTWRLFHTKYVIRYFLIHIFFCKLHGQSEKHIALLLQRLRTYIKWIVSNPVPTDKCFPKFLLSLSYFPQLYPMF